MKSISKTVGKIKNENWKCLVNGLKEKLCLTQTRLGDILGLKSNNSGISDWINGKNLPLNENKFKIIDLVRKHKLKISKLINLGKKAKNSIKFNNKYYPLKKALEKSYFEDRLIIKIKDKNYLNLAFLFPESMYDSKLKFIKINGNILIFYRYRFANNLRSILIPQYLELDKDFLVGLGIYLAEGARNRSPKITNSEPIIINQGIKFFKLFNFNKKDFNAWIQLHERSNKSFNQAEKFWIKNTDLSKQNIKKIRIKKSTGTAEVEPYGTLHLEIYCLLFRILINNLLKFVPKIIKLLSNEQLIWFLQGAFSGEGYVSIRRKSGSVRTITYTSTRKEERSLIEKILFNLEIKVQENSKSGNLNACSYNNLKKFYDINIFKYHPYRKDRLKNGLNKLEKGPIPNFNKNRIINLLRKTHYLTSFEISKFLNLSYECAKKHLRELEYTNKINKINGSGSIPHKYFIDLH